MKNKRSKWKLPSIDNRTTWKFPDVDNVRSLLIRPDMIGEEIHVYNGKTFKTIIIKLQHVGNRIGDIVHSKILYKKEYVKRNYPK